MHAVAHGVGISIGSLQALRVYLKQFSCFVLVLCPDRNWILRMVSIVNVIFGKGILWALVLVVW